MRLQAYEVVYQTMEKGEHSDSVFHRIVEQNDFLTRDKRFLKRLSYGTIERSVELDAILNQFAKIQVLKMTAPVRTVLRMALYEIRYMEKVPEAVSCHEAVELLKKKEGQKHTAFVNGVLRTILRNGDSISLKPWESLSLPRDLYDHLCEQYGKKTTKKINIEKTTLIIISVIIAIAIIINAVHRTDPSNPKAPPLMIFSSGNSKDNKVPPNRPPLTSKPRIGPCSQFQKR